VENLRGVHHIMAIADAIVVGAGIVGAACAAELSSAGFHVTVCQDTDVVGDGATAAGMGHLAVMEDSEAQFALTSYSQSLWRELASDLPSDAEYLPCGSLWIAADEEEMGEVRRKHRFYSSRDIPVEILDEKQLLDAEPHLRTGLAGGLLMPDDSVCYPPSAARFLLSRARAHVLLSHRVVRVSDSGVELANGEHVAAGLTIVAAGTATIQLLPELPIVPRKGHLVITDRYPGWLHHQLIELGYLKSAHSVTVDSVAFNAQPRTTGQLLIGSSRQYGTEDSTVERRMLAWMIRRAIEYMPSLAGLSALRAWTGFRPATPDKLPVIGRCPRFERVYVAAGHEGLGISTSLASARLLVDEIIGRSSAISRAAYAPERSFVHA
jgi:glycine/D-amino acid oxidase-like deaminating enzyme